MRRLWIAAAAALFCASVFPLGAGAAGGEEMFLLELQRGRRAALETAFSSRSDAPGVRPAAVYGADDRQDLVDVNDLRLRRAAYSVAALFAAEKVRPGRSGDFVELDLAPYTAIPWAENSPLCSDEKFYGQGGGAYCTAFLVAPDLAATARHCLKETPCGRTRLVFGFSIEQEGSSPAAVSARHVYSCAETAAEGEGTADWALIRLDRPAADREPLPANLTGRIARGTPLAMIGHPLGLPAKAAGGAKVLHTGGRGFPKGYFSADLDAFGNNSGSPVFNARTGLVEGILARGSEDFGVGKEGCYSSFLCREGECAGELVLKMSVLAPHLSGRLYRP